MALLTCGREPPGTTGAVELAGSGWVNVTPPNCSVLLFNRLGIGPPDCVVTFEDGPALGMALVDVSEGPAVLLPT